MTRLLRWSALVLGSLATLAIVAALVVYVLSEHVLRRTYPVPPAAISVPTDRASIAEGRRLATIYGCYGGCHGSQAQGTLMIDQPLVARLVAPNLTVAAEKFSDEELAAVIRNGLRPDGRSVLVMPSSAFVGLSDGDLGRIIAFVKSLTPVAGPGPSLSLGPVGRLGLVAGKFRTEAQLIAETLPPPEAASAEAARGRYLARTSCAHCHGTNLRGSSNPDFTSPDLGVVAAYSPDAFQRLLRTGAGLGGRSLTTMGPWARAQLSQLTDAEIAALYAYLHALPDARGR